MRFEEVLTAVGERDGSLVAIDRHVPDQPLVAEVAEVGIARAGVFVAYLQDVALRDRPTRADGREPAAVLAVEFVAGIPVGDELGDGSV